MPGNPFIWTLPRPDIEPHDVRRELARRHLHVFGPTTAGSLATWAGIPPRATGGGAAALGVLLVVVAALLWRTRHA